jgi:hypothetical protein
VREVFRRTLAKSDHATLELSVMDESPKMLLVVREESALREDIEGMAGWSIHLN